MYRALEWCPDGRVYVAMCFIVRSHEALACAAMMTANLAIAAHTFGDRLSTIIVSNSYLSKITPVGKVCGRGMSDVQ